MTVDQIFIFGGMAEWRKWRKVFQAPMNRVFVSAKCSGGNWRKLAVAWRKVAETKK